MKNILTIAVGHADLLLLRLVDLQLQPARPADRAELAATSPPRPARAASRGATPSGPNLTNNINLIFFLAFLLFSWTTASIMSGAMHRARAALRLPDPRGVLGSVVWILDAAWGWSAGGWMTLRFGFHDSIASGVVHGVAGAFTLGVLFNLGPRIGKYTKEGLARTVQTAQPAHHPAGADADLHGLLRLLRRLPRDRVDRLPGLGDHLPQPDDARLDHDGHHDGLRRRVHGRLLRRAAATRSGRSPAASPA